MAKPFYLVMTKCNHIYFKNKTTKNEIRWSEFRNQTRIKSEVFKQALKAKSDQKPTVDINERKQDCAVYPLVCRNRYEVISRVKLFAC